MKVFKFEQENTFREGLSLTVKAKDENEAKSFVETFIKENTTNPEETYNKGLERIKKRITGGLKHYENMVKEDPSNLNYVEIILDEKDIFIDSSEKRYSLNDFKEDETLYNKFAEKQAKDTYIWTFKNMPYELKEVEALYSGIITHNLYNI